MGIYTSNRYFGYDVPDYAAQIPANEAYDAAFGCAHIIADCQANDMALFESTIYSDMNEVMSLQEGYQVVNENAFTNVIKKIVEMFKKLIAKIKGIFNAFIAKLGGFAKNGKDLVKKYEKQILKYSNWKEFKVKVRRPKGKSTDIIGLINENIKIVGNTLNNPARYTMNTTGAVDLSAAGGESSSTVEHYEKFLHDKDTEDIKDALLKLYVKADKSYDYKDFSTELTDEIYEDEEVWDGDDDKISSSSFTTEWIKGVLMDTKLKTNSEKCASNLEKAINVIIDNLNKTHDNLAKKMSDTAATGRVDVSSAMSFGAGADNSKDAHYSKKSYDFNHATSKKHISEDEYNKLSDKSGWTETDDKDTSKGYDKGTDSGVKSELVQKGIQCMQKVASNEQEVVTKVTSEYMSQIKFAMAQAKKIWTAAAAYSSTTHKEDASYYEALGECAAEQVYQSFEAING